ncbi:MAG: RHS repeat-associated core domain-containing protein, partial [Marinilabiliaceae bacterium]|nr:RHS repeat-associated core domain-containing protein [Marinilabiliaceae bacterium]
DYSADGVKRRVTHQWLVPSVYQPEVSIDTTAIFDHPYLNERGDDDMLPSNKGFTNGSYITKRKTTDYVGNKIYEDGRLDKILFGNGYIKDNNYYFYVKDHLGNNRVVLKRNLTTMDDPENPEEEEEGDPGGETGEPPILNPRGGHYIVVQRLNYYASGLIMPGGLNPEEQKFSYNDKEFDSMHGLNFYDFGARFYDAALMRWHVADPLAEQFDSWTPYRYGFNNPLRFVDILGLTEEERLHAISYMRSILGSYKYDCSESVARAIIFAGLSNPKNGPGIGIWTNGVARIASSSTQIEFSNIEAGNAVTFRSGRSDHKGDDCEFDHIGIVTSVARDEAGEVTSFMVIHSTNGNGIYEQSYSMTNGMSGYELKGAYKWDTAERTIKLSEVTVTASAPNLFEKIMEKRNEMIGNLVEEMAERMRAAEQTADGQLRELQKLQLEDRMRELRKDRNFGIDPVEKFE